MKKSTLITTIAMIVVVVVALSTATYAWFSSQSQTYATQSITTTAASEITVITNDTLLLTNATKATFVETKLLDNTQKPASEELAGIRAGLWAPYLSAALSVKPNSNSSTDAVCSGVTSFVSGQQNQVGSELTVGTAPTVTSADMIRVTNNKATASHIILTIYIAAVNNSNSKLAAQGVSFYIHDNDEFVANTEYTYMDSAVITSGNAEAADTMAITKIADSDAGAHTATFRTVAKSNNITDSASANHRSTDTTVGTNFTDYAVSGDGAAAKEAGLVSCEKGSFTSFYTLTIDLGEFDSTESRNFLVYNWLDGTYLTDAAGNAGIGIAYSFAFPLAS